MAEEQAQAVPAETSDVATFTPPADTPTDLNPSEAARLLASLRNRKQAAPPPAAAAPQSEAASAADDAAPQPEATGETDDADPAPQEEPPLERPRSWSKDRAEAWAKLDRDTQQYLLDHDREASSAVRKAQNEAAEKLKSVTAREQAAEQARQQYESALPQLVQTLMATQQAEFADIKTVQDVEKLAREDWPRYLQWDLAQKKVAAAQQEMLAAQQRQAHELQSKFAEFAKHEDDLFIEKVPEMADADKAAALQKSAMSVLKDIGFAEDELARAWQGTQGISLRDHRVQLLIRDATLWRQAQSKAKTVSSNAKPLPPVQRPGTAKGRGEHLMTEVQAKLDRLPSLSGNQSARAAADLLRLRRQAAMK